MTCTTTTWYCLTAQHRFQWSMKLIFSQTTPLILQQLRPTYYDKMSEFWNQRSVAEVSTVVHWLVKKEGPYGNQYAHNSLRNTGLFQSYIRTARYSQWDSDGSCQSQKHQVQFSLLKAVTKQQVCEDIGNLEYTAVICRPWRTISV